MEQYSGILVGLVQNVALLLAAALFFDLFASRWRRGVGHLPAKLFTGFLLGVIGMVVMLTPWTFSPGVVFDTRSVLIGITGLFFGTVPALVTMGMTSALRLYQGGAGAVMGVSVILASGIIGLLWRYRTRRLEGLSWLQLYIFGLAIHIVMLMLTQTLPEEIAMRVFSGIWLPVLLIYPVATALLGSLMLRRLASDAMEDSLCASELRHRIIFENSPLGMILFGSSGTVEDCNDKFVELMGSSRDKVIGFNTVRHSSPAMSAALQRALNGQPSTFEDAYTSVTGGRHLILRVIFNPVRPGDSPTEVIATLEDITERRQAEESLRAREAALNSIFRAAPVGIGVVVDRVFVRVNDRLCEMTGYSQEDLMGSSARMLYPDDESYRYVGDEKYRQIRARGTGTVETRWRHKNGTIMDVLLSSTPMNPADYSVGVTFTALDITERKRGEEMLRESEARFRTLHNASFGGITIHDQGRILDCNQGLADITGYTVEELVGMDGLLLIEASCRNDVMEKIRSGYEKPYESLGVRKNGEVYPICLEARQIPYKGRQVRVTEFRDITEQKRAEEAIRQSEERFRLIIEDVEVAVQGYDSNLRVIYWNKASERLYGYTEEEAMGRSLLELIIPEPMRDAVEEAVGNWVRNGVPIPAAELVLQHKDGSEVPVYSSHAIQRRPDGGVELFCVDVDLSDFRKMHTALLAAKEQAEAANRSKSEFLANMSHELRTPLNGIMGMLQLMEATPLDEEQRDYARAALESSRRLTRLLSDILDLSRIEAGKMELYMEPFDLRETLHSMELLFRPSASQSGNLLEFRVSEEFPSRLMGDVVRLQQVISNLVGNALKFTKGGSVTVEAYPLPAIKPHEYRVLFSIADTGMGIPDDKQNVLFQPFTQVDGSMARQHQGAGLGLSICKRLVALMGGSISIASEPGTGTTVHFCVTLGRADGAVPLPDVPEPAEATLPERPLRILLAEDDRVNRSLVIKLMEKHGHAVTAVEDGQQAVRALAAEAFDVLLMDVQMPVMDGVQATRAIRDGAAGKERKNVPIVALTAHAMSGDRERLIQAGADEYLAKPFDVDTLLRVLRRSLR